MKKVIAVSLALLGLLGFVAFTPGVPAAVYDANMSPGGPDVAYARASGGANCYVHSSLPSYYYVATWPMQKYYYDQENFESWSQIQGRVKVTLDAPGWFDESYYELQVIKNGVYQETKSGSSGGTTTIWVYSSVFTTGPEGAWTFIIRVWALDSGALQCMAQGEFQVPDI